MPKFLVVATLKRGALPEPQPLDQPNQLEAERAYWQDRDQAVRQSPQNVPHWDRIKRQMKAG